MLGIFYFERKEGSYVAVFRIEKARNFIIMANHHPKSRELRPKNKGPWKDDPLMQNLLLAIYGNMDFKAKEKKGAERICIGTVNSILILPRAPLWRTLPMRNGLPGRKSGKQTGEKHPRVRTSALMPSFPSIAGSRGMFD